jgi:threonine dehydratase
VRSLAIKFEGANPTGTVKDRSSATGVAAALQFGFTATSVVSSGNAGSSIAAYSARAGLRSLVFAYERASAPKLLHMAATTPDLVIYQGVYDDLITIWDRLVEDRLFFDCGASRNAYKQEGKKTLAYEIAEQTAFAPPDVVVAPVAAGDEGAAQGVAELRATIAKLTRIRPTAPRLTVIVTKTKPRRVMTDVIDDAITRLGLQPVARIPDRTAVEQADVSRTPIAIAAPDSAVALAHEQLADHLEQRAVIA